jgi:hypothetical protein
MKIILTNKTFSAITISAVVLFTTMSSQAEIYKWTDTKGITHYSAHKPVQKKVKSENIEDKIRSAAGKYSASSKHISQTSSPEKNKKNTNNKKLELEGPNAKLAAFCKNQRKNLSLLTKNYRNSWKEKNGKTTRLNQKQRQEKVVQIQKSIRAECSGV